MNDARFAPMGVGAFGVSTPFAYWGFSAVREIVKLLAGETLHLHLTAFDQLREGIGSRGDGSVVISADLPDAALSAFLCHSDLTLIAFADSIDNMVDWAADSRGLSPRKAVAFASQVLSALAPVFAEPRALVLGPQTPPAQIVAAIAEHLRPGLGDAHGEEIFATLVADGLMSAAPPDWRSGPRPDPVEDPQAPSDLESLAEMKAALGGYVAMFESGAPGEIEWTRPLFFRFDPGHWREPIDLTGPARAVFYGPYLHLPQGRWVARVEFEIDGAISGVEAATDVFMAEVLVEKVFEMPERGIFAFELAFDVEDFTRPVEIRIFTKRSAIEGMLLIRSVFVRQG